MAENQKQNPGNQNSIEKIKFSKNINESINIAMEDGDFDIKELLEIQEKFKGEENKIYDSFIGKKCELKNNSNISLNNLKSEIIENCNNEKEKILKTIESPLGIIFLKKFINILKNKPFIKDIFLNINTGFIFIFFNDIKDLTWTNEVLDIAISKDPSLAISFFEQHNSKDILTKAFLKNPFLFFINKSLPWDNQVIKLSTDTDFLKKIASQIPNEALKSFKYYQYIDGSMDVFLEALKYNPYYILSDNYEKYPNYENILNIAFENIKNSDKKDMKKVSAFISRLHKEKEKKRFQIIESWDISELYILIIEGREGIFTSTYNGIINRLMEKLKNNGKDIFDVAFDNNYNGISTFLEAATSFGRIEELFDNIKNPENKKILIQKLVESIKLDTIKNSIALIEIIKKINNKEILKYIGELIKIGYQEGGNANKGFGIIGKFLSNYVQDDFLKNLPDKYELTKKEQIESRELFDSSGRNIQQYFFYNDEDGKSSYDSFISRYKSDGNWKIEDKNSFVIIKSKKVNGKQIIIYANKPNFDGGMSKFDTDDITEDDKKLNGFNDISNEFIKINPPLESLIVVHRGHSYHAGKTIDRIPPIAKMVFLGSCGGFQNIGKTLEKSPNAHIISTKGTGTKIVNDPLFKMINDNILNGKDIILESIWGNISKQVGNNPDFQKYVRPDQNLGALFFNKYNSIE